MPKTDFSNLGPKQRKAFPVTLTETLMQGGNEIQVTSTMWLAPLYPLEESVCDADATRMKIEYCGLPEFHVGPKTKIPIDGLTLTPEICEMIAFLSTSQNVASKLALAGFIDGTLAYDKDCFYSEVDIMISLASTSRFPFYAYNCGLRTTRAESMTLQQDILGNEPPPG